MRQFTTRTGDFVCLGVMVGGLIGGFAVKESLDWGWVIAAAFGLGWIVNEVHRRHDINEFERVERENDPCDE